MASSILVLFLALVRMPRRKSTQPRHDDDSPMAENGSVPHGLDAARQRFANAKAAIESICREETLASPNELSECAALMLEAQQGLIMWAGATDANYLAEIEACCTVLRIEAICRNVSSAISMH